MSVVDNGGFLVRVSVCWPCSSLCIPTEHCTVICRAFTSIWTYSDPIACSHLFTQRVVQQIIYTSGSRVIKAGATLAVSQWTNWYVDSCFTPVSDTLGEISVWWLDWVPLPPDWVVNFAHNFRCAIGAEDDYEMKWVVLRNIWYTSS
jgi:hypothetical protein